MMARRQPDHVSFREGYMRALDDCEQLLREMGLDDAKEIINDLRRKIERKE